MRALLEGFGKILGVLRGVREVSERFYKLERSLRSLLKGFGEGFGSFERSQRGFGEMSRYLEEVLGKFQEVLKKF